MEQAKRYVDAVESETMNSNCPNANDQVARSWTVRYDGAKPVSITLRDHRGERLVVDGSAEWHSILAQDGLFRAAIQGKKGANEDSWNYH